MTAEALSLARLTEADPVLRFGLSVRPFEFRKLLDPSMRDEERRALLLSIRAQAVEQFERLQSLPPFQREVFLAVLRQKLGATTTQRLRDGTIGYHVRGVRADDCWAAAVATCLQVPLEQVPDARLDERLQTGEDPAEINRSAWAEFARWLDRRGLRMVVHRTVPVARRRWIGIVQFAGVFNNHCLVMSRDEVLFDPVDPSKHARRVRTFTASDIALGFSFKRSKISKRGDT